MKKILPALSGLFLLLFMSCQMNTENASGDVSLSFELSSLRSRTAMPSGLDLKPDYVSIQGIGPGGATILNYYVLPSVSTTGVQTLELGNLLSGTWSFKVIAYEWPNNVPVYNAKDKPIDGKAIGEGQAICTVRSGLMTPVEVVLLPYAGVSDGVTVTYNLKLTLDWSFESSQLRSGLTDLHVVAEISGPGGIFTLGTPTINELNAGVVSRTIDVGQPGSYQITAELWNGTTRLSRRFEVAYVTGNVLTSSTLMLYLNGGKSEFAIQDAIPNPIALKAMAVEYDLTTGTFSVTPDIADDAALPLGKNSIVMLFGWSPDGPIDFTDWYKPLNHTDMGGSTGLSSAIAGISYIFDAFAAELVQNGADPADFDQALTDAGVDPTVLLGYYAGFEDLFYGAMFYTTDDPAVFEVNTYPAYTPGIWPFSFETWTLDAYGNLLWAMTDVKAVVEP